MSTCSDYFAEIFDCIDKTPCKNPVVVLKDIKKSDLDALLDYMYLGEVDVRQSELSGLIKAAECLRIKGLAVPDEDPSKSARKDPPRVPERREESAAKLGPSPPAPPLFPQCLVIPNLYLMCHWLLTTKKTESPKSGMLHGLYSGRLPTLSGLSRRRLRQPL